MKNMAQVYVDVLFDAFYTEEASTNIAELNTRLEEIYDQYEIAKRVKFVVGVDAGRVAYIDNDVVILMLMLIKLSEFRTGYHGTGR